MMNEAKKQNDTPTYILGEAPWKLSIMLYNVKIWGCSPNEFIDTKVIKTYFLLRIIKLESNYDDWGKETEWYPHLHPGGSPLKIVHYAL